MRKLFGLVALLLVLALGVAIGAGPLGDRLGDRLNDGSGQSSENDPGADAVDAGGSDPIDSAFIAQVAPAQLAGALTGQAVSIISFPGASASIRTALSANIAAAGGAVASSVELTEEVTDAASKQLVDSLGTQLSAQVPGVVDPSLSTYPRMGALIGAAVGTNGTTVPPPVAVETIRDALTTGSFVSAPITGGPATLILVLAGSDLDDAILTGLLSGMQTQTKGLVLAGVTNDGDVASARDAALAIGTYDGTETAGGQVSSINLLAGQVAQAGGSYGASGSDGSVVLR